MSYSADEIEAMSYRELQSIAKEHDLDATGPEDELRSRVEDAVLDQESETSGFGAIKDNIEDELEQQGEQDVFGDLERVETGVIGLDDILEGGIPDKNLVLVSGDPGSGKTTLALQFIIEGIKQGEPGVYVNLDETKEKIMRNAKLFGWDLEQYIEDEMLHFVRPGNFTFDRAKKEIDTIASRFDAKRIVIDSMSVLGASTDTDGATRRGIMELNRRFNQLDATTLSISEVEGENVSKYGVEEYSVDGIIRLYFKRTGSSFQRAIAIKKMRGSDHSKDLHPIEIGREGVKVFPDEEVFAEL